MLKSSVQHKILNYLPDDRPITAIQIVENLEKCPRGFFAISKTYDQDSDADLRDVSIFKSSSTRYICLSKTEGLPNFVVQEIFVIGDKASPPKGFSVLNRTADSEQKAWKKKQLCYRLVNKKDIRTAVTDIIVCNRPKKAPAEFSFAGEINGVYLCYKMGNVQDSQQGDGPPERPPKPNAMSPGNPMYPSLDTDHDYEILRPGAYPSMPAGPGAPIRPAPKPPAAPVQHQNSTNTLGSPYTSGLDGVPFVVNPKFVTSSNADRFPRIKARTMQQILKDYDYPFTVERQT